ncbi:hypothetical protein BKA67DRAFT_659678 [Truncatella angustata]|uniref:Uncharacterized protein n=1 Tax=Truncatella angustata TaxID=152316 RepID=A0A9P8UJ22_9PEZI|nr:uncharacterized protein BKA67DRAFT_659678 [Truncatella angustata]KAH6653031.1 hypothetical protein BKA67DRAFT_659678 [Truncatella angustata]
MRHPYTPIRRGADDEDSSEKSSWPMTRRFHYDFHSMLRLLGIGFLIAVVATVGISLLSWHPWHSSDPAPSSAHCGNSSAEAAAMGCSFDIMSFTWSRKACFDEELMHEFLAARNWTWWLASDGNQEVAMETVALGIHPRLFVSWEYHLFHCTYMWKKMHRALLRGTPLDSYLLDQNHTAHCSHMLLDRNPLLEQRNTIIVTKYPSCSEG